MGNSKQSLWFVQNIFKAAINHWHSYINIANNTTAAEGLIYLPLTPTALLYQS